MARKDSEHQKKSMSALFKGKAIFKPLNTGRIDERVACVREWVANIFFYRARSGEGAAGDRPGIEARRHSDRAELRGAQGHARKPHLVGHPAPCRDSI